MFGFLVYYLMINVIISIALNVRALLRIYYIVCKGVLPIILLRFDSHEKYMYFYVQFVFINTYFIDFDQPNTLL